MIARLWRGRVPEERAVEYLDYLRRTGLADYRRTDGHLATWLLRRTEAGVTEFLVLTVWASMDAIRLFAGDDPGRARYYPEDAAFLLELPARVEHYELVEAGAE